MTGLAVHRLTKPDTVFREDSRLKAFHFFAENNSYATPSQFHNAFIIN